MIFVGIALVQVPRRAREVTFGFVPVGPSLAELPRFHERFRSSRRFVFGVSIHTDVVAEVPHQYVAHEITYADRASPVVVTHRSEEHKSELQSLMRISYAVF